jgi:DNA-binding NarL/FixJ family response regulator
VSPIRVVLATMPPLLGDIVRATLARDADIEIAAEVATLGDVVSNVGHVDPDVVVLGVAPADWVGLSGFIRDLLAERPRLMIVALASDGRSGYVYGHHPRGVVIDDISPKSLAQLIRSNAAVDVHPPLHPFSAE